MEKAYDLKDLGQKIVAKAKEKGLALAEETVETLAASAYLAAKEWVKESATLSENKVDDLVAPFIDHLDGFVLPQINKLDLDGDGK